MGSEVDDLPTTLLRDVCGREVVEDVEFSSSDELEFCEFHKNPGEEKIDLRGWTMFRRSRERGGRAGLRHAEMVRNSRETSLSSFRGKYLAFPGTVRKTGLGRWEIPLLVCHTYEWHIEWFSLDLRVSDNIFVAHIK